MWYWIKGESNFRVIGIYYLEQPKRESHSQTKVFRRSFILFYFYFYLKKKKKKERKKESWSTTRMHLPRTLRILLET